MEPIEVFGHLAQRDSAAGAHAIQINNDYFRTAALRDHEIGFVGIAMDKPSVVDFCKQPGGETNKWPETTSLLL